MFYTPLFGFQITKSVELDNCRIHPVYSGKTELNQKFISNEPVPCTAIIESEEFDRQFLFWLEICCTLADQRCSRVSHTLSANSLSEALSKASGERLEFERPSGPGKLIIEDSFQRDSRQTFLRTALAAVYDESATEHVELCQLLHKTALCYMGGAADYVEIKYFMLFSGLEALARKVQNDSGKDTAKPLADYVSSHGFDFFVDRKDQPFRQARTYTTLRNASFHNGKLEAYRKAAQETYQLSKFHGPFERLVSLLLLKQIGFDDGRINWNSWLDRMPFK